ncbi:MAG: hypothetical protein Q9P01_14370 [Anaerolineae bacterium]|nr:hypothetical protein [Anaerolineae bacterium]MDQ7035967.1 hypothetical protein [Anaerolineae bacterium]
MGDNKTKASRQIFDILFSDVTIAVLVILLLVIASGVNYFSDLAGKEAQVAYLYPLDAPIQNVWIAPVDDPSQARAVTDSEMGIFDFGVSPDGRFIAYSERHAATRTLDIYLLDLQTGAVEQLTDCGSQGAECYTPIFHPSDNAIVYMRQAPNLDSEGHSDGAPDIWVLDIATGQTQSLSVDSQTSGYSPQWADDGNTIVFFSGEAHQPGILVYNFTTQDSDNRPSLNFVPSSQGSVGALSPDGRKLIFPDMIARQGAFFAYMKIVDFTQDPPVIRNFTDPQAAIDDSAIDWHPSGQFVTIERRYMDERYTRGFQLYNIDVSTQEITPLLVDENYSHHYFAWNRTGDSLVVQRIPLLNDDGTANNQTSPQIWVLDAETGAVTLISEQAFHPRWIESQ